MKELSPLYTHTHTHTHIHTHTLTRTIKLKYIKRNYMSIRVGTFLIQSSQVKQTLLSHIEKLHCEQIQVHIYTQGQE